MSRRLTVLLKPIYSNIGACFRGNIALFMFLFVIQLFIILSNLDQLGKLTQDGSTSLCSLQWMANLVCKTCG